MAMNHNSWLDSLLENLVQNGEEGRIAVEYIRAHSTKISFKQTKSSIGAWWTIGRNINLNSLYFSPDQALSDSRVLRLIIHEVRHLQQGFFNALSVYGELDAWQFEWSIYHRMHGGYPHPALEELMSLPLGWDRNVLRRTVQLMQTFSSKDYRVDLLPYYPLGKEISFRLFKKVPQT